MNLILLLNLHATPPSPSHPRNPNSFLFRVAHSCNPKLGEKIGYGWRDLRYPVLAQASEVSATAHSESPAKPRSPNAAADYGEAVGSRSGVSWARPRTGAGSNPPRYREPPLKIPLEPDADLTDPIQVAGSIRAPSDAGTPAEHGADASYAGTASKVSAVAQLLEKLRKIEAVRTGNRSERAHLGFPRESNVRLLENESRNSLSSIRFPWEKENVAERRVVIRPLAKAYGDPRREVRRLRPAELFLSEMELKRLRFEGLHLAQVVRVGKQGVTQFVREMIYERWRWSEVVKINCQGLESPKDMKNMLLDLEQKTGGLIVWTSRSTVIIYRGKDYHFSHTKEEANQMKVPTRSESDRIGEVIKPIYEEFVTDAKPIDQKIEVANRKILSHQESGQISEMFEPDSKELVTYARPVYKNSEAVQVKAPLHLKSGQVGEVIKPNYQEVVPDAKPIYRDSDAVQVKVPAHSESGQVGKGNEPSYQELVTDAKTFHQTVEAVQVKVPAHRESGRICEVIKPVYQELLTEVKPVQPKKEAVQVKLPECPKSGQIGVAIQFNDQELVADALSVDGGLISKLPCEQDHDKGFDAFMEGLGPRMESWARELPAPIDGDLLPAVDPSFKTPFRKLPYGYHERLSNRILTILRRISEPVPPHFIVGRDKGLEGLAGAIVKVWERSEIVKICVKRGTLSMKKQIIAEELKLLTGGIRIASDKSCIVLHRGNDFLPPTVAAALREWEASAIAFRENEEKARTLPRKFSEKDDVQLCTAGSLKEFKELTAKWDSWRTIEDEQRDLENALKMTKSHALQSIQKKLNFAFRKKQRAEQELEKVQSFLVPTGAPLYQEKLTDEEKFMFRKIGLRMKAYLLLGRRGVFDGAVLNMHLHWKYRELVKVIIKERDKGAAEITARMLEYESGGVFVCLDTRPKEYLAIFYRGKNYQRPLQLNPPNLLTKRKALKRAIELQRCQALGKYISYLELGIQKMQEQMDALALSST